jgi:hypothetical protein
MVLSMALQEVVGVASVVPARHPKLAQLHRWLSSARSDELVAGTESWRLLRRGAYVGLDRPHLAVGLLQLLKAADVSPSSIRVRFAHRSCDSNEDRRALEKAVRERIRGVLGADVIVECASERRGRPRAYLLVGSENASRSSAALGLKGFHLLLFVASIYVELARSQESIQ